MSSPYDILVFTSSVLVPPLLFPYHLSQSSDGVVLQDLRLVLGLKHSVGHHGLGHLVDGDGHRGGGHRRDGAQELPGQPLGGPALLPVHQQHPVGAKTKVH